MYETFHVMAPIYPHFSLLQYFFFSHQHILFYGSSFINPELFGSTALHINDLFPSNLSHQLSTGVIAVGEEAEAIPQKMLHSIITVCLVLAIPVFASESVNILMNHFTSLLFITCLCPSLCFTDRKMLVMICAM